MQQSGDCRFIASWYADRVCATISEAAGQIDYIRVADYTGGIAWLREKAPTHNPGCRSAVDPQNLSYSQRCQTVFLLYSDWRIVYEVTGAHAMDL